MDSSQQHTGNGNNDDQQHEYAIGPILLEEIQFPNGKVAEYFLGLNERVAMITRITKKSQMSASFFD